MSFLRLLSIGFVSLVSVVIAADAVVPTPVTAWMSWEDGVDVACMTKPGLSGPDLILHVARIVHTPVGSAASGLVVYQPEPGTATGVMGFVCDKPDVGAYFGPHIFAGTPFENAPVLPATITVDITAERAHSRIEVGGHVFTVTLSGLLPTQLVSRAPGAMPFHQQGVESIATNVVVTIDGKPVSVLVGPAEAVHGASAVYGATGIYAR